MLFGGIHSFAPGAVCFASRFFGFFRLSVCAACNILAPRQFYQVFIYFSGLPFAFSSNITTTGFLRIKRKYNLFSIALDLFMYSCKWQRNNDKNYPFLCHMPSNTNVRWHHFIGSMCALANVLRKKIHSRNLWEYRLLRFFFRRCLFDSNNYNNITLDWHRGFACILYYRRRFRLIFFIVGWLKCRFPCI